jgi:hypothetical protein
MGRKYYVICLYDLKGKLLSHRKVRCGGCGAKRMPKTTPACVRYNSTSGKIFKSNAHFKKIKHLVEESDKE